MVDPTTNDNDVLFVSDDPFRADAHRPDPYGQAAMVLIESLIHGLIDRSVISVGDAIEIMAVATDVNDEVTGEPGYSPTAREKSLTILDAIRASLEIDLAEENAKPWPPLG